MNIQEFRKAKREAQLWIKEGKDPFSACLLALNARWHKTDKRVYIDVTKEFFELLREFDDNNKSSTL